MKYKKLKVISIAFLVIYLIARTLSLLYPFKMLYVECEEIMIEDYEEHFGYPIPRNNKTKKVFEQPEKYTIINYSIWIKNNTSKKLFIEEYTVDIPKYHIVYSDNEMDFSSQYEYKPTEENRCFGKIIIYTGDNDKQFVLKEITESMKLKVWYWINYNDFISLLTFSKMQP